MISELQEVISKVEQLELDQQKQIAKMFDDEIKWDSTLQESQEKLYILAQEALDEYKSNKTQQKDW